MDRGRTPEENPYEVIGAAPTASEAEIRRAYFEQVREHPPEQDAEQFKRIRTAYEVLRDPARRAESDLLVALLPPPPLPSRRRPRPDLSLHREDAIWVLRAESELYRQDFQDDFRPITPPELRSRSRGEQGRGTETRRSKGGEKGDDILRRN